MADSSESESRRDGTAALVVVHGHAARESDVRMASGMHAMAFGWKWAERAEGVLDQAALNDSDRSPP